MRGWYWEGGSFFEDVPEGFSVLFSFYGSCAFVLFSELADKGGGFVYGDGSTVCVVDDAGRNANLLRFVSSLYGGWGLDFFGHFFL